MLRMLSCEEVCPLRSLWGAWAAWRSSSSSSPQCPPLIPPRLPEEATQGNKLTFSSGYWSATVNRQNEGFGSLIHFIRIRIQHSWLNTDPDLDPIRIQGFYDQKFQKIYSWKYFFSSKTTIYLSLGFHEGRPSYRRSLQPSKENIQRFKRWNLLTFFYFLRSFLLSWIQIRIQGSPLNPDPIRIRINNTD